MFRSHILKKNIRNLYTIDTDVHTSNSITTTTLNGFTFPTEDGSASQVLSTNGSGVLSFISTTSGELINDTTPQLAGNLDLNSFNITGSGNWEGNNLTKSQVGLSNVENVALSTWVGTSNITTLGTITTGTWSGTAILDAKISSAGTWNTHVSNTSNPHSVTKSQVSLGNVEDVALSTWTGTSNITTLGTITTGTWSGTAILDAKISSAGTWNTHVSNTSNPHSVTKSQVSLGNVEDVALSTWVGTSNITTLGTITTGTWSGTALTKSQITDLVGDLSTLTSNVALKSNIASPLFTGNVGIGTTSADEALHVVGDLLITGNIQDASGTHSAVSKWTATGDNIYYTTLDGKVGIGTNNPQELLHIQGSSNPTIRIQNTISVGQPPGHTPDTEYGSIDFWTSDGNYATSRIVSYQSGGGTGPDCGLKFYVNENNTQTDAMFIKHNGNVGIGASNPTATLTIEKDDNTNGQLLVKPADGNGQTALVTIRGHRDGSTGNNSSQLIFENYDEDIPSTNKFGMVSGVCNNLTTNIGDLVFSTYADGSSISERMRIESGGNVGIGTNNPTELLHVNGTSKLNNIEATSIDTGGLEISGLITTDETPDRYLVNNMKLVQVTGITTTINSNSFVEVFSYNYSPVSNGSSSIIVQVLGDYEISGYNQDEFQSRLSIDDDGFTAGKHIHYKKQFFDNQKGGGTRSGTLFPLWAERGPVTFVKVTAVVIKLEIKRVQGADTLTLEDDIRMIIHELG